jgi:transcription factor S
MDGFCPKCGSLLVPSLDKKILTCSCGYKSRTKVDLKLKEKKEIEIVKKFDQQGEETLSKVKEDCPKCKNEDAYFWTLQTRAADEAATQFFRCTKCKHTWRDYE